MKVCILLGMQGKRRRPVTNERLYVMYEPREVPATPPTRLGKLQDLDTTLEMPNEAEVHLWTHGDDGDEETVHAMLDAPDIAEEPEDAKDPQEAFLRRLHGGGGYIKRIIDD